MKRFSSFILALCMSAVLWGQDIPKAQMWFDSGMLFYGTKSANIISDNFLKTVQSWKIDNVHIAVSPETTPEAISQLILSVPFSKVSYSLTLDKDRISGSAATEQYYRKLPQTEGVPFNTVDTPPYFVEGKVEEWVKLRADVLYPRECWENGIQGRVILQFTIDEQGRAGNVKILKSAAPQLDKIAERIILSMPDWKPALDASGKPVKVSYNIPIVFRH